MQAQRQRHDIEMMNEHSLLVQFLHKMWYDMFLDTWWGITLLVVLGILLLQMILRMVCRPGLHVDRKHVFVTGGSTGLGKAFAAECVKRGANVTIVSRTESKLRETKDELEVYLAFGPYYMQSLRIRPAQKVVYYAADVRSADSIAKAVEKSIQECGDIEVLICNAGLSHPDLFTNTSVDAFKAEMDLNYIGCVSTIKAAIEPMIERRRGRIVIVSSAMAMIGFAGYSIYAPTKWALRALGDCLRNEFKPYNVMVQVFCPANMLTPAFEQENITKPEVTKVIEGTASTVTPEVAAKSMVSQMESGDYFGTNDFMIDLLRVGANAPRPYLLLEILFAPLIMLLTDAISRFYDHVSVQFTRSQEKKKH